MAKYHLKSDGSPAVCTANIKACPRGGEDAHYESEDTARQAYESSMSSSLVAPPSRRGKRTLLERLQGKSEEEALRDRVNFEFGRLKYNMHGTSPLRTLYEAAEHYDVFRAETTAIVKQGMATQEKIVEIEATARTILRENPRAFTPNLEGTVGYLNDWDGYKRPAIPRILEAGEDVGVHRQLMPMLESLVNRRLELRREYAELEAEAEKLTEQVKKEGNMSPDQRSAISDHAKAMYEQALASHHDIPAPEIVQDRRAWAQSREAAVEELQQRGVL